MVTRHIVPVLETFAVPVKEIGLSDADRSDTSNFSEFFGLLCLKPSAEASRIASRSAGFMVGLFLPSMAGNYIPNSRWKAPGPE
jgi:hypothetical protein